MTPIAPPLEWARTALLVMDYQNATLERIAEPERLLAGAREAIALVRERGGVVGYVRVGFAEGEAPNPTMGRRLGPEAVRTMFGADAPATQIHDAIAPREEDIVVRKTRVGPFGTTDLDEQLRRRGVDTLLLAGISTSGVLLSAVRDGADRDYRLIVVADLCADPEPEIHDFLVSRILHRQAEVIDAAQLAQPLS